MNLELGLHGGSTGGLFWLQFFTCVCIILISDNPDNINFGQNKDESPPNEPRNRLARA